MADYKFNDPQKAYAEALSRIRKADKDGAKSLKLYPLGLTSVPPEIGQLAQRCSR